MNVHEVIRRPLVTEKTSIGREEENLVTFAVDPRANKHDVKRAVESLLDVCIKVDRDALAAVPWDDPPADVKAEAL